VFSKEAFARLIDHELSEARDDAAMPTSRFRRQYRQLDRVEQISLQPRPPRRRLHQRPAQLRHPQRQQ
jgi:hypothetical protein